MSQDNTNLLHRIITPKLPDRILSAYDGITNNAWSSWSMTGYNNNVSTVRHDLNFNSNNFDFDTAGSILDIQSDNIGDSLGSTGINTIILSGVGTDWNELVETVNLNGTNTVNTINQFLRLNYIIPVVIGSNSSALGNITLTGDGFTWGEIPTGETNPHLGRFSVPRGKTLIFDASGWSCDKTGEYFISAFVKQPGVSMFEVAKIVVFNSASNLGGFPTVIQEKNDFVWRCQKISGAGSLFVSILSSGVLVDNNRLKNKIE